MSTQDNSTSCVRCQYPKQANFGLVGYGWVIVFAATAFVAFNVVVPFTALGRGIVVAFCILAVSFVSNPNICSSVIAPVFFRTVPLRFRPVKLTNSQTARWPHLGIPCGVVISPSRGVLCLGREPGDTEESRPRVAFPGPFDTFRSAHASRVVGAFNSVPIRRPP